MAARRAEDIQSSSLRSDRIIRKRLVCHCSVFIQRRGSHFDIRAMLDVSSACRHAGHAITDLAGRSAGGSPGPMIGYDDLTTIYVVTTQLTDG